MNPILIVPLVLLLHAVFILGTVQTGHGETELPRVLVVHSYHEDQREHVMPMTEGIKAALLNIPVEIRYLHMDAKRNNSEQWKIDAGKRAELLLEEFKPLVVIAMDDIAQHYFTARHAGLPGPPYFVFGGVNKDPACYGFPADNVTGVLERPVILESIQLLQKLVPQAQKLLILADKSVTTDSFISYCKTLTLPVSIVAYEQPQTFAAWQETLERYHDTVDAIGIYVIRTIERSNQDHRKVPEQELIAHINDHYRLPTVGFFDTSAESGILCGVSVSMFQQGYSAGIIAAEIIGGKKPNDFSIANESRGRIQLNLKTAELLGIQIPYTAIQRAEIVVR